MTFARTPLLLALVLLPLSAAPGAQAATLGTIQGEAGTPVLAGCGITDAEQMGIQGPYLAFPALGCTALYLLDSDLTGIAITRVNVALGAGTLTVCGTLVFAGAVVGASVPVCSSGYTPISVPVYAVGATGTAFTVTWVPDPLGPVWVNLLLDSMEYVRP